MAVMGTEQLQAQVMLFLEAFDDFWSIGLLIFGLHIFLLGYLVLRSGYVPKTLGVLLIIASVGYLTIHSAKLLFPGYENYITIIEWIFILPMVVGELGLALWLLIKGVKVRLEEVVQT